MVQGIFAHLEYYQPPAPRALPSIIQGMRAARAARAPGEACRDELEELQATLSGFLSSVGLETDLEAIVRAQVKLAAVRHKLSMMPAVPADQKTESIAVVLSNLRDYVSMARNEIERIEVNEIAVIKTRSEQPFRSRLTFRRDAGRSSVTEAHRQSQAIEEERRIYHASFEMQIEGCRERQREWQQRIDVAEENLRLVEEEAAQDV